MSLVGSVNSVASASAQPANAIPQTSFKGVLSQLPASSKMDPHTELVKLQQQFLSGKKFEPRELLYYQIRAGQFGLGVELVSKLAESISSAVRKFEQGQ